MKIKLKNIAVLIFGCFLAFVIFEIFLQVYNPFKSRVSGDEIELPANQKYEYDNVKITGLDKHIVHNKNSLGFRGAELPKNENILRIFCVGGSTAECFYISNGGDWPALLQKKMGSGVWVNNAGLDGHSSWGHIVLLRDHLIKYKPKYILFLVGCNDVASENLNIFENRLLKKKKTFLQYFETYNLIVNLRRMANAGKRGMRHNPIDFRNHERTDTSGWRNEKADDKLINAYRSRIGTLIKICRENGIVPIFITQPTILSNHSENGMYFGDLLFLGKSALHYLRRLDGFIEALKEICEQKEVGLVDLAKFLEPETANYYDFFHFTKVGAERVSEIIYSEIQQRKLIEKH